MRMPSVFRPHLPYTDRKPDAFPTNAKLIPSEVVGGQGQLQAWFYGASHEGVFLGETSSHSLQELI